MTLYQKLHQIWIDPVWSKIIATLILAVASLLIYIVAPYLLIIVLFVLLIGISLYGLAFFRRKVVWNFNGFLGMIGPEIRIVSFQAMGHNRSKVGFFNIRGNITSNIDNSTSELRIAINGVPVPPSATTGIPPGAKFQIEAPFCDTMKGNDAYLTEYEFMRRWGSFRFKIEMGEYIYEKVFSERQIYKQIDKWRRINRPRREVRLKNK